MLPAKEVSAVDEQAGSRYRIDYSHRLGWVVTVGCRVRYFSPDYDDCERWVRENGFPDSK